ncbi:YybH family protein [Aliikangiella sp. IMCC44653]
MKTANLILFILSAITLSFASLAEAPKTTSVTLMLGSDSEPAKVVNLFHKALKNKNTKVAISLLDDNVLIYEGGRAERSATEYAHHHMLADMNYLAGLSSETLEHQVRIYADTAISTKRTQSKGRFKGKEIDSITMETMVLRKLDGQWKISHIHWSN